MSENPDLKNARRRRDAAIDLSKIDRLPPFALEAEAGVLGCCLLDPNNAIGVCVNKFKARKGHGVSEVFYDLRHQVIYDALVEMSDAREPIDIITFRQRLKDNGNLDSVGGVAYLTSLVDATPSAANLPFYADIIIEKHLLRRMIQTCSSVVGRIYQEEDAGDVESLLDEIEKEVLSIAEDREETEVAGIKDLIHQSIGKIEEMHANAGKISGLSTGFIDLDKITTGLQDGEMIVIAARPSQGKTSLAMNIAEHVAVDQQLPVGVFSLEMSAQALTMRMLCSRARVNIRDISEGFLHERDFPKITNAAGKISNAPLYIDDTAGLSILQLRAKARRMHQKHEIKLFVVDYLQLLCSSKRTDNRQEEVSDISHGIKALAKELKVPIIVLAQLNREIEKREAGAKPKLSDLRESGTIEADADLVGLLYKPQIGKGKGDDDGPGLDRASWDAVAVNLLIAKQRNGPSPVDVHLTFIKGTTRFESAARVAVDDEPVRIGKNKASGD